MAAATAPPPPVDWLGAAPSWADDLAALTTFVGRQQTRVRGSDEYWASRFVDELRLFVGDQPQALASPQTITAMLARFQQEQLARRAYVERQALAAIERSMMASPGNIVQLFQGVVALPDAPAQQLPDQAQLQAMLVASAAKAQADLIADLQDKLVPALTQLDAADVTVRDANDAFVEALDGIKKRVTLKAGVLGPDDRDLALLLKFDYSKESVKKKSIAELQQLVADDVAAVQRATAAAEVRAREIADNAAVLEEHRKTMVRDQFALAWLLDPSHGGVLPADGDAGYAAYIAARDAEVNQPLGRPGSAVVGASGKTLEVLLKELRDAQAKQYAQLKAALPDEPLAQLPLDKTRSISENAERLRELTRRLAVEYARYPEAWTVAAQFSQEYHQQWTALANFKIADGARLATPEEFAGTPRVGLDVLADRYWTALEETRTRAVAAQPSLKEDVRFNDKWTAKKHQPPDVTAAMLTTAQARLATEYDQLPMVAASYQQFNDTEQHYRTALADVVRPEDAPLLPTTEPAAVSAAAPPAPPKIDASKTTMPTLRNVFIKRLDDQRRQLVELVPLVGVEYPEMKSSWTATQHPQFDYAAVMLARGLALGSREMESVSQAANELQMAGGPFLRERGTTNPPSEGWTPAQLAAQNLDTQRAVVQARYTELFDKFAGARLPGAAPAERAPNPTLEDLQALLLKVLNYTRTQLQSVYAKDARLRTEIRSDAKLSFAGQFYAALAQLTEVYEEAAAEYGTVDDTVRRVQELDANVQLLARSVEAMDVDVQTSSASAARTSVPPADLAGKTKELVALVNGTVATLNQITKNLAFVKSAPADLKPLEPSADRRAVGRKLAEVQERRDLLVRTKFERDAELEEFRTLWSNLVEINSVDLLAAPPGAATAAMEVDFNEAALASLAPAAGPARRRYLLQLVKWALDALPDYDTQLLKVYKGQVAVFERKTIVDELNRQLEVLNAVRDSEKFTERTPLPKLAKLDKDASLVRVREAIAEATARADELRDNRTQLAAAVVEVKEGADRLARVVASLEAVGPASTTAAQLKAQREQLVDNINALRERVVARYRTEYVGTRSDYDMPKTLSAGKFDADTVDDVLSMIDNVVQSLEANLDELARQRRELDDAAERYRRVDAAAQALLAVDAQPYRVLRDRLDDLGTRANERIRALDKLYRDENKGRAAAFKPDTVGAHPTARELDKTVAMLERFVQEIQEARTRADEAGRTLATASVLFDSMPLLVARAASAAQPARQGQAPSTTAADVVQQRKTLYEAIRARYADWKHIFDRERLQRTEEAVALPRLKADSTDAEFQAAVEALEELRKQIIRNRLDIDAAAGELRDQEQALAQLVLGLVPPAAAADTADPAAYQAAMKAYVEDGAPTTIVLRDRWSSLLRFVVERMPTAPLVDVGRTTLDAEREAGAKSIKALYDQLVALYKAEAAASRDRPPPLGLPTKPDAADLLAARNAFDRLVDMITANRTLLGGELEDTRRAFDELQNTAQLLINLPATATPTQPLSYGLTLTLGQLDLIYRQASNSTVMMDRGLPLVGELYGILADSVRAVAAEQPTPLVLPPTQLMLLVQRMFDELALRYTQAQLPEGQLPQRQGDHMLAEWNRLFDRVNAYLDSGDRLAVHADRIEPDSYLTLRRILYDSSKLRDAMLERTITAADYATLLSTLRDVQLDFMPNADTLSDEEAAARGVIRASSSEVERIFTNLGQIIAQNTAYKQIGRQLAKPGRDRVLAVRELIRPIPPRGPAASPGTVTELRYILEAELVRGSDYRIVVSEAAAAAQEALEQKQQQLTRAQQQLDASYTKVVDDDTYITRLRQLLDANRIPVPQRPSAHGLDDAGAGDARKKQAIDEGASASAATPPPGPTAMSMLAVRLHEDEAF